MGKARSVISFLKDAAEVLLYLVGIAVLLFLPTIITYIFYWGRINDTIEYVNTMVQLLWIMMVAMMSGDDEDDK
jgi:predicted membrane protein